MEASRIARDSNKERNDAGATEGREPESARELYALPLMARNKGQKRKNGNKKREGRKKGKSVTPQRSAAERTLESGADRACRGINSRVLEQSRVKKRG